MNHLPFLWSAAIVFAATLLSSWCWVLYFRFSHARQPLRAALSDCGIIGLGMIGVVGYTEDHRLALPVLVAAFIGTYTASRKGSS